MGLRCDHICWAEAVSLFLWGIIEFQQHTPHTSKSNWLWIVKTLFYKLQAYVRSSHHVQNQLHMQMIFNFKYLGCYWKSSKMMTNYNIKTVVQNSSAIISSLNHSKVSQWKKNKKMTGKKTEGDTSSLYSEQETFQPEWLRKRDHWSHRYTYYTCWQLTHFKYLVYEKKPRQCVSA